MAVGLVLLVSADPVAIQQFGQALQELSITPDICGKVPAAIGLLNRRKFDAVIVDLQLGEHSGMILPCDKSHAHCGQPRPPRRGSGECRWPAGQLHRPEGERPTLAVSPLWRAQRHKGRWGTQTTQALPGASGVTCMQVASPK